MHMVFEGELAVKLHAKDVEVLTSLDRNSRQNQVTMGPAWGGLTVQRQQQQVSLLACL